jgi:hypothetical protein
MSAVRKGNWMQTVTGRAYWPLDPRPDEVFIEDIAHALAHTCRYGGHCSRFYSVAEHSWLVSYLVPCHDALAALMHDATEAYVTDVPRPLKKNLTNFKDIEALNWHAIAERFDLPHELPQTVHDADNAILFTEQRELMLPSPREDWGMGLKPPYEARVRIQGYSPDTARRIFLDRFHFLNMSTEVVT